MTLLFLEWSLEVNMCGINPTDDPLYISVQVEKHTHTYTKYTLHMCTHAYTCMHMYTYTHNYRVL